MDRKTIDLIIKIILTILALAAGAFLLCNAMARSRSSNCDNLWNSIFSYCLNSMAAAKTRLAASNNDGFICSDGDFDNCPGNSRNSAGCLSSRDVSFSDNSLTGCPRNFRLNLL